MRGRAATGRYAAGRTGAAVEPGRILSLDVLRGVAILLVLGRHAAIPPERAGVLEPVAQFWLNFGWTGVGLFFVLSGYLVGSLLLREAAERDTLTVGRFLVRRGFKIWPAYYAFLCFMLVREVAMRTHASPADALVASGPFWLHVQNYLATLRPHNVHLWSLAVEEHFYLALPLLLLALRRAGRDRETGRPTNRYMALIPWVSGAVLAACLVFRLARRGVPFSMEAHLFPTHINVDGLFLGVTLAYLHAFRPEALHKAERWWGALLLTGLALLTPIMANELEKSPFVYTYGYTLVALGYACLLLAVLFAPRSTWLGRALQTRGARVLAFVGVYSYSIYLWHLGLARVPVGRASAVLAGLPPEAGWLVGMAVYVAVAIGAGYLLSRLIEVRALRLRERLFPRAVDP